MSPNSCWSHRSNGVEFLCTSKVTICSASWIMHGPRRYSHKSSVISGRRSIFSSIDPSRLLTMNFDSYPNNSPGCLSMRLHDSIEQSEFRIDPPSLAKHRTNSKNENPVPPTYAPFSPPTSRSTHNLHLSPWDNKASIETPSFSRGLAMRVDYLTIQLPFAKGAWMMTTYPDLPKLDHWPVLFRVKNSQNAVSRYI
jgi:hypothetical protein